MERKNTEEEKQSTTAADDVITVAVEEDTTHHAADWADFMEEGDPDDVEDEEDCYESELKASVCNVKLIKLTFMLSSMGTQVIKLN